MTPAKPPHTDRLAGLDGMRGFFITAVILVHLQLWNAGWFAIPMFFVMSGFLITRILLADQEVVPRIRAFLVRFYARRVQRIVPIFYFYLLCMLILGLVLGQLSAMRPFLLAGATFVSNFYVLSPETSLASGVGRLFLHTWSLAVEEQFYLMWPLLIALVPRRRLPLALWIIGSTAIVYRCVVLFGWPYLPKVPQTGEAPYALLYLTPFNWLDAFAIGAAMNLTKWAPRPWQVYSLAAFTLFVGILNSGAGTMVVMGVPRYLVMGYPALLAVHKQAIWGYTLIALNAYVLILATINGGHFLKFFGHPILDWVGKRTYSLYLFHVPAVAIFAPARKVLTVWMGSDVYSGLAILPPVMVMALLFCHIGYTLIEKPINANRNMLIPAWAKKLPTAGSAATASRGAAAPRSAEQQVRAEGAAG